MNGIFGGNANGSRDEENASNNHEGNHFRLTVYQKQRLEEFFKNCPHPNKNQRQELSKELRLEPKQIKFWFQNRRTQRKVLCERAENDALKLEYEKVLKENITLKEVHANPFCTTCDYFPLRDESHQSDIQKLRTENWKLKKEHERLSKVVRDIRGKKILETQSFSDTAPSIGKPIPEIHSLWPSLDADTEGFGRAVLMDISHKMVKNFWKNLDEFGKLDLQNDGIRVFDRHCDVPGQLVVSASFTLWLGVSCETLFDFLVDEKSRVQWDFFSNGSPMKAIAHISFGSHPGCGISIFQPSSLSKSSNFIIQESFNNPLGSVIIYAPISIQWVRSVISGGEDSYIPILPAGFIISGDEHFEMSANGAATSSSSRMPGGSVLAMHFQMFDKLVSESGANMEPTAFIQTIVTSTMQKITAALNC